MGKISSCTWQYMCNELQIVLSRETPCGWVFVLLSQAVAVIPFVSLTIDLFSFGILFFCTFGWFSDKEMLQVKKMETNYATYF